MSKTKDKNSDVCSNMFKLFLNDVDSYNTLSSEEQIELGYKVLEGDKEAREKLINSCINLVIFIAYKYTNRGLDMEDLVQYGCLGLVYAVDKYDPSKGYKFSTYAQYWIIKFIQKNLFKTNRVIRLSSGINILISKVNKATAILSNQLGAEPTDDELANYLDISKEKLTEIKMLNQNVMSLDYFDNDISKENDFTISDIVAQPENENTENKVLDKIVNEDLFYIIDKSLSEREKEILFLRFGIDNTKAYNLDEIADLYDITKERVRQIVKKSISKIKKTMKKYNLNLEDFLC